MLNIQHVGYDGDFQDNPGPKEPYIKMTSFQLALKQFFLNCVLE